MFAKFEVLIAQLHHHTLQSSDKRAALPAKLSDLAPAYCGSPIDISDYLMKNECFEAIKSLRSNDDIFITKFDKGSDVVIANKAGYISKMESILHDNFNFKVLGPIHSDVLS